MTRLRRIFHLGTADQENGGTTFGPLYLERMLRRMGYTGDLPVTQHHKNLVFGRWRYLFHVIVSVFKPTKTGHDTLDASLVSMIVAMVQNRSYAFSRYIFRHFRAEAENPTSLLLYPRFVMIIIRHVLGTDVPTPGLNVRVTVIDKRVLQNCRKASKLRAGQVQPQEAALFGALDNPNYEEPENEAALPLDQADGYVPVLEEQPQGPPPADEAYELAADVLQFAENDPGVDTTVVHDLVDQLFPPEDVLEDVENFAPQQADDVLDEVENFAPNQADDLLQHYLSSQGHDTSFRLQDDVLDQVEQYKGTPSGSQATELVAISATMILGEEGPTQSIEITVDQDVEVTSAFRAVSEPVIDLVGPSSLKRPIMDVHSESEAETDPLVHRPRKRQATEIVSSTPTLADLHQLVLQLSQEVTVLKAEDIKKSARISALEAQVQTLSKSSQVRGEDTCKDDQLRFVRRSDDHDDPSAQKEKELVGSSQVQTLQQVQVRIQGESGQAGASGSGAQHDDYEDPDTFWEIDTERDPNTDVDGDVFDLTFIPVPQEASIIKDGVEKVINIQFIKDSGADAEQRVISREDKQKWFGQPPAWLLTSAHKAKEELVVKKYYTKQSDRQLKLGIISWMFDRELQLFIIKRFDGVQYLPKDKKAFNSFPASELHDLSKLPLIQHGEDDPYACYVGRIVKNEGFRGNFVELTPAKGRCIINKKKIDPQTGRPETRTVYPPVTSLLKIPLKDFGRDILQDLYMWAVDTETGEAVMYRKDDEVEDGMSEILRIVDATQLVNLTEKDLQVLHKNKIYARGDWADIGRDYQRIVAGCINMGINTDSALLREN